MTAASPDAARPGARRLTWRRAPRPEDPAAVRRLAAATGFFSAEEVEVAGELVEERLARGEASGYLFLFADLGSELCGYSCFGPIALTRASWDLFWIVVSPALKRRGIGRRILAATETEVLRAGGERLYVETSTRAQYRPTRIFYEQLGYRLEARLPDFYAPGDGKAIFCRVLSPPGGSRGVAPGSGASLARF